jgi:anti-anti-sigma factor
MAAIAEGHQDLILDVRDVPTIDGAGANSLLVGMRRAQQAGGELRIVGPTDPVRQRLELAAQDDVLPVHATVVEALESIAVVDAHKGND